MRFYFGIITSLIFGRPFKPTNVVHPQDKGEKINLPNSLNIRDVSRTEVSHYELDVRK